MVRVLNVVGKMNRGGLETFVMNVLRASNPKETALDILCTIPGLGDYDSEVRQLGSNIFNIGETFASHSGKCRYIAQYKEYLNWFNLHPYDVIHIHGSHAFDNSIAVCAALKSGCKKVISHSHTKIGEHMWMNRIAARYLRSQHIIRLACSQEAGVWLYGDPSCFEVIANGIDVDRFVFNITDRTKCRSQLNILPDSKVMIHTGRLVDIKNQTFLLDVLCVLKNRNLEDWHLILIGTGPNLEILLDKAKSLNIEDAVHFLGLRPDVYRYLSASDVYVMPSLYEGLPLAAVEAQANGLPSILSNGISRETKLIETAEFLDLNCGPVVWADVVEESMCDREDNIAANDSATMVKNAGFDIHRTVDRLLEIYTG